MIITKLLEAVLEGLDTILGAIPNPTPPDIAGGISTFVGGITMFDMGNFVPMGTIAAALIVLLGWSLAISGLRFGAWVLALLHIAGTDAT